MIGNVVLPLIWNLRKHWKLLGFVAILLAGGLYIAVLKANDRHKQKIIERKDATINAILRGQAEATARAETEKRLTEQRHADIQKEKAREIAQLATDYDARTRRFLQGRSAVDLRSPVAPDLSGLAQPSGPTAAPDGPPILVERADLDKCNAALVTATGWQRWYGEVSKAAPR